MLPIKDIIKETPLVDMNISTNLCCPNCHSARLRDAVDSVLCEQCEHSYLVMFGIIDFREATIDATANFSIETDRILAGQLALAFPFLKTFNELYDLFLLLRTRQGARESTALRSSVEVGYFAQAPFDPGRSQLYHHRHFALSLAIRIGHIIR